MAFFINPHNIFRGRVKTITSSALATTSTTLQLDGDYKSVNLTWTNGAGNTGFANNISANTYNVTNLLANNSYTFTITPFKYGNGSGNPYTLTVVTLPVLTSVSSSGTTTTATSIVFSGSFSYVIITWGANTSGRITTSPYNVTGLTASTAYTFTVTPYNSVDATGTVMTTNVTASSSGLYAFTSFTFTNAGALGRYGPTLDQCRSAYSAATWTQDTSYFNMTTPGIQLWTVPSTGNYRIIAAGAGGGAASSLGGRGIVVYNDFSVTSGTVFKILVGQKGGINTSSGGGGGTFVINTRNNSLIVAGGGAGFLGGISVAIVRSDGAISTAGENALDNSGIGGSNGGGGTGSNDGWGCGGGGLSGNGTDAANAAAYSYSGLGVSFVNGGYGGGSATSAVGGFGGGGGTHGNTGGGGGGGGYSGGGGSNQNITNNTGGGGGSYNGIFSTYNLGQGYVTITKL